MEVDAFIADHVAVAEGKLYANGGGWDRSVSALFPAVLKVGLGVLIKVPWTATNETHLLEIHLEDPDGNVLPLADAPPGAPTESHDGKFRRIKAQFTIGRPAQATPGDEQTIAMAVMLDPLSIETPGRKSIILQIDGTPMKRLTFTVDQAPQIQVLGQPPVAQ